MALLFFAAFAVGCTSGTHSIERERHGPFDAGLGPFLPPTAEDYYPAAAKRQGVTGRVELECSIDAKGSARDIVVLESGGSLFDDAARKLVSNARFLVPPDWAAAAEFKQRFRYGVIFRLIGKPEVPVFSDTRRIVIVTSGATP